MDNQFSFMVSANVTQEIIELAPGYTNEKIIEGLQSGDMATSIVNGEVLNLINGEVVAKVINVDCDGEFEDFN